MPPATSSAVGFALVRRGRTLAGPGLHDPGRLILFEGVWPETGLLHHEAAVEHIEPCNGVVLRVRLGRDLPTIGTFEHPKDTIRAAAAPPRA